MNQQAYGIQEFSWRRHCLYTFQPDFRLGGSILKGPLKSYKQ